MSASLYNLKPVFFYQKEQNKRKKPGLIDNVVLFRKTGTEISLTNYVAQV